MRLDHGDHVQLLYFALIRAGMQRCLPLNQFYRKHTLLFAGSKWGRQQHEHRNRFNIAIASHRISRRQTTTTAKLSSLCSPPYTTASVERNNRYEQQSMIYTSAKHTLAEQKTTRCCRFFLILRDRSRHLVIHSA